MSLAALGTKYVGGGGNSKIDFDLALKQLEEEKLIGTGPMAPYENIPGSSIVILMIFSKREYAYLTEKGYKALQKSKAPPAPSSSGSVHISGAHFISRRSE